ncbi:hypothetical protein [Sicyoidochytrium minutum DNA virus]|nr:hypothetical protein [Sicyoidochytrium minutum DNA virus]
MFFAFWKVLMNDGIFFKYDK